MSKKLTPNHGYAVLSSIEGEESTYGNIIIPDMGKETGQLATVISIADIYNFNTGELVKSKFKAGDIVLFPPMGGQRVKVDGKEFLVVSITDLLVKIG